MKRVTWLGVLLLGAVEFVLVLSVILWMGRNSPPEEPGAQGAPGPVAPPSIVLHAPELGTSAGYEGVFYEPVPGFNPWNQQRPTRLDDPEREDELQSRNREFHPDRLEIHRQYLIIDPPQTERQEGDWNPGEPYAGEGPPGGGGI